MTRRAEWLRLLPEYDVRAYEVVDRSVELRASMALVVQRVEMRAVVEARTVSGTFVLVDLWTNDEGPWQVWRRHSTRLRARRAPSR